MEGEALWLPRGLSRRPSRGLSLVSGVKPTALELNRGRGIHTPHLNPALWARGRGRFCVDGALDIKLDATLRTLIGVEHNLV